MVQQESLKDGLVAITDPRFSAPVDTDVSVAANPDQGLLIGAFLVIGAIMLYLFTRQRS